MKKDLHSTKSSSTTSKKMPMVTINEKQNENHYADLDYQSDDDDGSAMMVQATNNKQVNGITVIQLQGQNGTHHGTTILIDNGFTGHAIMSHSFAEKLGYKFQR